MTRNGGYTRLLRIPNRQGDNAPMAVIELVDNPLPSLRPPREERRKNKSIDTPSNKTGNIDSKDNK